MGTLQEPPSSSEPGANGLGAALGDARGGGAALMDANRRVPSPH